MSNEEIQEVLGRCQCELIGIQKVGPELGLIEQQDLILFHHPMVPRGASLAIFAGEFCEFQLTLHLAAVARRWKSRAQAAD